MQLTSTANELRQFPGYLEKFTSWLAPVKNKSITDWTVDQLDIQPYQRILEIGYASGYTLQEVARKLKIGFLAGIDESMIRYQQAYRRNKKLIRDQLLQLHIGDINELPYPHHYFHTIFASRARFLQHELKSALLQLTNLLKSGGKLVVVFQPAGAVTEQQVQQAAENIKRDYIYAGLTNIQIELRDMYPATCIAVTGYKE